MTKWMIRLLIVAMVALSVAGAFAQDDLKDGDDPVEGPPGGPLWDIVDNEITDSSSTTGDFVNAEDDGGLDADPECVPGSCWCVGNESDCVDELVLICELTGGRVETGPDATACWYDDDDPASKDITDLAPMSWDTAQQTKLGDQ